MKLPTYQSQVTPAIAPGAVRVNPAAFDTGGAEAIAAGAAALGAYGAEGARRDQIETARRARVEAGKRSAELRGDWTAELAKAEAQAPENPEGFAEALLARFDEDAKARLEAAPEAARERLDLRISELRSDLKGKAFAFEAVGLEKYQGLALARTVATHANTLRTDFAAWDAVAAEVEDVVAGSAVADKPSALRAARQTLAVAALQGLNERDPEQAEALLAGGGRFDEWLTPEQKNALVNDNQVELRRRDDVRRAEVARLREGVRDDVAEIRSQLSLGLDPGDAAVKDLTGRAAATGDARLAEQARDVALRRELQRVYQTWSPADLQNAVNARRADVAKAGQVVPGAAAEIDVMESLLGAMNAGLVKDPLSWAARAGIAEVAPVRLDGEDAVDSMKGRVKSALGVAEYYGVPPRFLTDEEATQLKTMIGGMDADGQLAVATRLAEGFGGHTAAVLGEFAEDAPQFAHAAGLATLGQAHVGAARDALAGRRILADGKDILPLPSDRAAWTAEVLGAAGGMLPATRAAILDAAAAIYASRATRRGLGREDGGAEDLWKQALHEAAGGTADGGGLGAWNDRRVILPPGLGQDEFEDLLEGVTDADLAAAGGGAPRHANGEPFTADQLQDATLIDAGQGLYLVDMGESGDALIAGERGVFVLDLAELRRASLARRGIADIPPRPAAGGAP